VSIHERFEEYVLRKVYDNETGTSIDVGLDVDGLGLVEVDGGDTYGRIVMDPAMAAKVASAMAKCAAELAP
jgi:hypothetical protein